METPEQNSVETASQDIVDTAATDILQNNNVPADDIPEGHESEELSESDAGTDEDDDEDDDNAQDDTEDINLLETNREVVVKDTKIRLNDEDIKLLATQIKRNKHGKKAWEGEDDDDDPADEDDGITDEEPESEAECEESDEESENGEETNERERVQRPKKRKDEPSPSAQQSAEPPRPNKKAKPCSISPEALEDLKKDCIDKRYGIDFTLYDQGDFQIGTRRLTRGIKSRLDQKRAALKDQNLVKE